MTAQITYPIVLLPPKLAAIQAELSTQPIATTSSDSSSTSIAKLSANRKQWAIWAASAGLGSAAVAGLSAIAGVGIGVLGFTALLVLLGTSARRLHRQQQRRRQSLQQDEQTVAQLDQLYAEIEQEQRREQVLAALQGTTLADGRGRTRRNRIEPLFHQYLDRAFPGKIHCGLTLSRPEKRQPYYPDLAYVDPVVQLCIDIEIDEPYAYKTGHPIHYIGSDDTRNQFFLDRGWLVLRFSEEQAICHPDGCCKAIAQLIATVLGEDQWRDRFYDVPDLEPIPQWTKAEAEQMATQATRDCYRFPTLAAAAAVS